MAAAEPTLWERLTSLLRLDTAGQRVRNDDRIDALTRAIARDPQSAASYVTRGELYLQRGETDAARQDFRQALALAEAQFKTETWGIVAQAIRDRALRGLQHT